MNAAHFKSLFSSLLNCVFPFSGFKSLTFRTTYTAQWPRLRVTLGDLLFRAGDCNERRWRTEHIEEKVQNQKYRVCVRSKETPADEWLHCSEALCRWPFNFTLSRISGAVRVMRAVIGSDLSRGPSLLTRWRSFTGIGAGHLWNPNRNLLSQLSGGI